MFTCTFCHLLYVEFTVHVIRVDVHVHICAFVIVWRVLPNCAERFGNYYTCTCKWCFYISTVYTICSNGLGDPLIAISVTIIVELHVHTLNCTYMYY